jgi:peptidoglycan/xylan/chitin deacetylase (PgdA/CDA1 family)
MIKKAYLTIDDSPSADWSEKLRYLVEKDIQAVWFSTGENLEKRPEFVPAVLEAGHYIANHSFTHPDFSTISLDEAETEVARTQRLIDSLAGKHPGNPVWFRFPFGRRGDTDDSVKKEARFEKRDALQAMLKRLGFTVPNFFGVTYDVVTEHRSTGAYDWWWTFDFKEWAIHPDFSHYGLHSLSDLIKRLDTDYYRKATDFVGLNGSDSEEVVLIHDHAHSTQLFTPLIGALLKKGVEFSKI